MLRQIQEFGRIAEGSRIDSSADLTLDQDNFSDLVDFIETNSYKSNFDKAFTIYRKSGRRFIQVKNYVGLVETTKGLVLEILPKIYDSENSNNINDCKKTLIKMLRVSYGRKSLATNYANLKAYDNMPIFEEFINSYINETELLLNLGLSMEYQPVEERLPMIRGKLLTSTNLISHVYLKNNFECRYDEFNANYSPNKLIKSTLILLRNLTKLERTRIRLIQLLESFNDIDVSLNYAKDFEYCKARLSKSLKYKSLLKWSEAYLNKKSFMIFHGNTISRALLYPMEKLFEDYIAYLFRKYTNGYTIKTQEKKYYILNQKANIEDKEYSINRFLLKPDMVINNGIAIIDTKWKLIEASNFNNKDKNISEADIYQMHAYGRKYSSAIGQSCKLVMLYPMWPKFTSKLPQFTYGDNITLDIIPFSLLTDPQSEVNKVVQLLA